MPVLDHWFRPFSSLPFQRTALRTVLFWTAKKKTRPNANAGRGTLHSINFESSDKGGVAMILPFGAEQPQI